MSRISSTTSLIAKTQLAPQTVGNVHKNLKKEKIDIKKYVDRGAKPITNTLPNWQVSKAGEIERMDIEPHVETITDSS